MNREELSALLDSMREALEALTSGRPVDKAEGEADSFMAGVYRLGLELHGNAALRASPEYRKFLEDSSRVLPYAMIYLEYFVDRLLTRLYHGSILNWKAICEKRSGVEFFFELYRDTPFAGFLENFELGELDPALRRQAVFEGYVPPEEIPPSIPESHWWWRPTQEDLAPAQ